MFRLDRQRWTRQATSSAGGSGWVAKARALSSSYLHVLAMGWLFIGVILISGLGPGL